MSVHTLGSAYGVATMTIGLLGSGSDVEVPETATAHEVAVAVGALRGYAVAGNRVTLPTGTGMINSASGTYFLTLEGGSAPGAGTGGGNGLAVRIATDGMIDLGPIELGGGPGGDSGRCLDGSFPPDQAGPGGCGGTLELTGCVLGNVQASGAVPGIPAFYGDGPTGGTVALLDCRVGAISAVGGPGSSSNGPGGTFNDTPTAPGSGVSSNTVRG